jgi:hypothetical protein
VVARVIVNLFKAGDTQLPGNYRGSPWYQSAARCLQTCCASIGPMHLHEAQGVQKQRSCTDNLFVLTRILKRLARPTKLSMRSFWTCAKRMIRSGGMGYQVAREGVDGKLWRVLRDLAIKSTSQVRVNGDLSEAFPLSAGVGQGDYLRCCSISLSMTSWLDCMIRALSMASAWGRPM